ncbi:MAG: GHMP kinase [Bacteroidetes bacterium HGW-Bacteroidetes-1]|jgi:mevalonate kinase|nr:MAG: GHMP kinase [Bacteroidetes bacterium HGW-Bacteroidetes-1]
MAIQPEIFKSNGKLLLTGEYLVLRGALSLALPLKRQQSLEIETFEGSGHPYITWFAFAPDKIWFKTTFELPSFDIIATDDRPKSAKLQLILLTLKQLKPEFFDGTTSYRIVTRLGFEPQWGLGSSSTLIANLAKWTKTDPYTLLQLSMGGSGYDIACANASQPLFFQLKQGRPFGQPVDFHPDFSKNLFFIYRGQKKDSAHGIRDFNLLTENQNLDAAVNEISDITREAASIKDFNRFCILMNLHEDIISAILLQSKLNTLFTNFNGSLKSLGAWGGDFILAMTDKGDDYVRQYFSEKGLDTIFKYNELVK